MAGISARPATPPLLRNAQFVIDEHVTPPPTGIKSLSSDWRVNQGRPKIQLALVFFRAASLARRRFGPKHPIAIAVGLPYRFLVEWILGIEIPWQVQVGPRLRIFHGFGIVVNPAAIIGADVGLRHGVTIGNRLDDYDCPVILDGCELGTHASVLGAITVGPRASVGAHALALRSVPAETTVVGVPARPVDRT